MTLDLTGRAESCRIGVSGGTGLLTGTVIVRRGPLGSGLFFKVNAETFGHAVKRSAVDAEDLGCLTSMMFGDFKNVEEVAAF